MQVDDAEDVLAFVLPLHPLFQGTEVVAEMKAADRLNAGENAGPPGRGSVC